MDSRPKPFLGEEERRPLVLVMDDEEALRDSVQLILARDGFDVAGAGDGFSGLNLAARLAPDVVLVDLKMPGVSGQEILERLGRSDPHLAKIVVTAYATVSTVVEAMRLGANDFLTKPFTPEELRSVVRRALERRTQALAAIRLKQEKELLRHTFLGRIGPGLMKGMIEAESTLVAASRRLAELGEVELAQAVGAAKDKITALSEAAGGPAVIAGAADKE